MFSQFFKIKPLAPPATTTDLLQVGARSVPLVMVQNPRARRYLMRLRSDGVVRVTIPRRGNLLAARAFTLSNVGWLEQQLQRIADQPKLPLIWKKDTEILFRGDVHQIQLEANGWLVLGNERIKFSTEAADLRPTVQKHLHQLAAKELTIRVFELAAIHGIEINHITVRDQRSRWGSCSRRGTISLNWRLIQMPDFVRDYIILHELAHRRQMNHSAKFWAEVARLCPDYAVAERWLKQHAKLLR